jgi:hypothetical protein
MARPRGVSWKARALERKGSVQARAVGIAAPGAVWVAANKVPAYWPRLERLVPGSLRNRNCRDTYELLNN